MTTIQVRDKSRCACGAIEGRIEPKGAQDCIYCIGCGKWLYNAPRLETGREVRSVRTVHEAISTKQRARIILRAGAACELCHASNKPLHVGHLLSVNDGLKLGLNEVEINSDENLAAMCDECNLGLSDRPVPIRLMVAVLIARMKLNVDQRS